MGSGRFSIAGSSSSGENTGGSPAFVSIMAIRPPSLAFAGSARGVVVGRLLPPGYGTRHANDHRRSRQTHPVDRRRNDQIATAIVGPTQTTPAGAAPTQDATQPNPHRRQPANQPPRVPSWGAFGRRPQHRWIGHDRPASETLHRPGSSPSLA